MADEKVNGGTEEVNAAEPEVMEQAAVDTSPEAAAPEPEVVERKRQMKSTGVEENSPLLCFNESGM